MKITEKERNYIITILKIHKESYNDLLRGFGDKNEIDIFLENLIDKLEDENNRRKIK